MTQPPIAFVEIQGIRTAEAIATPPPAPLRARRGEKDKNAQEGSQRAEATVSETPPPAPPQTWGGEKDKDRSLDNVPVLALHGWGANLTLMWPLAEQLGRLGYRVYAPDLPGFGQSGPPPGVWSVKDYADFVIAYLDFHHLNKVNLIGHSFGGRLGLVLGAEYPERIVKMVLADSAGVRSQVPFLSRARQALYKAVRDTMYKLSARGLADRLQAWYIGRYASPDYKEAGALRQTFVKVVNEDLLPYAARVKPSTLLLWGEEDEDTPVSQGQLLEKTIPDGGLHVFPGAGHYSYLDKLGEAVKIIDYFFKQE
jgi:pimeloyl-ACP methyl ester carboxylesterase